MNYKLLVLDIDGTTADSQKKIAPEIRDALIRLQLFRFRDDFRQ